MSQRPFELLIGQIRLLGLSPAQGQRVQDELALKLETLLARRQAPSWTTRSLGNLRIEVDAGLSESELVERLAEQLVNAIVNNQPETMLRGQIAPENEGSA